MEVKAYKDTLFGYAKRILGVDSPSGYGDAVTAEIGKIAAENGFPFQKNRKGCGYVTIEGKDPSKTVCLCSHVDTLGLMVRSITEKGDLKFTIVGLPILPTLDGEYCRVRTRDGRVYTGTILSESSTYHVHDDSASRARDEANMVVRLDEEVHSKADVEALGILAGDYICIDPKTVVTENGFLKSRFIDDKGSASCLLTLLNIMKEEKIRPQYNTVFLFTIYEETGNGASWLPENVEELLIVDMGCVGLDMGGSEYKATICAKDTKGPYNYEMTTRLVNLARENGVDFAVDIFPHYLSDSDAALNAGYDIATALIGPGVNASHGMERTHYKGLENTIKLAALYLGLDW